MLYNGKLSGELNVLQILTSAETARLGEKDKTSHKQAKDGQDRIKFNS